MKNKVDLFLDSGAFSAWTQKVQIDIQEYIAFIKAHEEVIEVYANLDAIGDPVKTWKNQKIMEKVGLTPLPTLHYGVDEKWIKRYLKLGYEYLALGGMVPISTDQLIPWLDWMFSEFFTDKDGLPIIKIHGFGLTSLPLMLRYPWYSVDSTSWVITGRMGSIYMPRFRSGEWIYDENSWKIAVSNRSPNMKEKNKHFTTMSEGEQQQVLNYMKSKGYQMGKSVFEKVPQSHVLQKNERWADKKPKDKTILRELEIMEEEGICNRYQLRDEMNIIYFLDLEKSMPEWPWPFKKQGISGLGL